MKLNYIRLFLVHLIFMSCRLSGRYVLEPIQDMSAGFKLVVTSQNLAFYATAGKCFTLHDAVKSLLPEYFPYKSLNNEESSREEDKDEEKVPSENLSEHVESCYPSDDAEVKLVRIQGIEPKLEIPFSWVVNNLVNPEHFLHLCVCLKLPQVKIPSDT
jgi:autophagy-related protein 5